MSDIPPNSIDHEQAVIGSVFLDPQLLLDCGLQAPDFWRDSHQHIWRAMQDVFAAGADVNWVETLGQLRKAGRILDCGGEDHVNAYLREISQSAVSVYGFDRNVATVKDYALKREVIRRAAEVRAIALDDRRTADDAVVEFSNQAAALLDAAVTTPDVDAAQMMAELEQLYVNPPETISTTYAHLDASGPFTLGSLNTIAGRPGHGKSTLAANFVERMHRQGTCVGVITLEMQRHQFSQLVVNIRAGVSRSQHAKGALCTTDRENVEAARAELSSGWKLSDKPMTVEQIGSLARKWQRKNGVKVLLIDHLQRIKRTDSRQDEVPALGHITWSLAELARSTGLVIILGAQLNREAEKDRGVTQQRHLKGSGSIEEDSAMVIQIKVDESACAPNDTDWVMDLVKTKDRYGSLSRCPVRFLKSTGRIVEIDTKVAVTRQFEGASR